MPEKKPKKYIQIKLYEEHSELITFLSQHKTESIIFMMQFFQKMFEASDAKTLFDFTESALKILGNNNLEVNELPITILEKSIETTQVVEAENSEVEIDREAWMTQF